MPNYIPPAAGSAPVDSVFGRTGVVAAATSDYDANQIDFTPTGGIASTDVQAAIAEVDSEKAATSHSHAAGDITSGTLAIAQGGTNAATASAARTNLDVYDTSTVDTALAGKADSSHNHAASDINSGTLAHEQGGLEADVSLYSGIPKISGGTTSQAVPGTDFYAPGSTDVAVADGGTGASTASAARTNLGLVIGTDVQAQGDVLDDLNTLGAPATDGQIVVATGAGAFAYESGATARASLGLTIGTDVQAQDDQLQDIADLTIAQGDLIYGSAANTLNNLAKGSAYQRLAMNSGATVPEWVDVFSFAELSSNSSSGISGSEATWDANQSASYGSDLTPNTTTDRITVNTTGTYRIKIRGAISATTSGAYNGYLQVRKNGTTNLFDNNLYFAFNPFGSFHSFVGYDEIVVDLTATDYLEVRYQTSNANCTWRQNRITLQVERVK